MAARELVQRVRERGGDLRLRDGRLEGHEVPQELREEVRRYRDDVILALATENLLPLRGPEADRDPDTGKLRGVALAPAGASHQSASPLYGTLGTLDVTSTNAPPESPECQGARGMGETPSDPLSSTEGDTPIGATVYAAAIDLGAPRVELSPSAYVGGSEEAWRTFCDRAPMDELRAAFSELEALEREGDQS